MNQDDLRVFLSLAEAVLNVEKFQIGTVKMFLSRFDSLEMLQKLYVQTARLPEGEQLNQIYEKLQELEQKIAAENEPLLAQLKTSMARMESDHEKLEASLAKMKESLQ